ncbi:MAG: methanogenesis marker 2 protein [Methanomassiliicoccales archaeon]|nr:methanogenesis marker 2 protein [Methanomassiliicoccales archaeon]
MDLEALVKAIRNHPGVTRKRSISEVIHFIPFVTGNKVLASCGEDCAVLEYDDSVLLLAADGIMEPLMKAAPYYAGYYSVLVNINDIAAMGGIPIAMVDIISMKDLKICAQVMRGVEMAVKKFGVPIVGGHTHPDCEYHAIDVAILGTAGKEEVIYSHTAQVGDDIIFAMDIDGFYPDPLPYAWDTTTQKDSELVRAQVLVMNRISKKRLVTSGKDMSNPGSIGTLGMLLETSGKGGWIDVERIPRPSDSDFIQWAMAYQGCGFVVTCPPENSDEVIRMYRDVEVTAAVVGKIDDSSRLLLRSGDVTKVLFDFSSDIITGCSPTKIAGMNRRF